MLKVNKSKITGEKAFNGDYFETSGNHESNQTEKILFLVFFKITYSRFNP